MDKGGGGGGWTRAGRVGSLFKIGRVLSANDRRPLFHYITLLNTMRPSHRAVVLGGPGLNGSRSGGVGGAEEGGRGGVAAALGTSPSVASSPRAKKPKENHTIYRGWVGGDEWRGGATPDPKAQVVISEWLEVPACRCDPVVCSEVTA